MAGIGVVLLVRSRLRRLGRLTHSRPTHPSSSRQMDAAPHWLQRAGFACLLALCLTIPSNWTQNVPVRNGDRHAGLTHSWLYPDIDWAPP